MSNCFEVKQITLELTSNEPVVLEVSANTKTLELAPADCTVIELLPSASITITNNSGESIGKPHVLGEDITANKVVVLIDGLLYLASSNDVNHAAYVEGITRGSGTAGDEVIVTTDGYIDNLAWSWNPVAGTKLFLSTNGELTESPDFSHAFVQQIATINSPTNITVDIEESTLIL